MRAGLPLAQKALGDSNVATVLLGLRERLGFLQELANVPVQPGLTPAIPGGGFGARRVRIPRRLEQRTRGLTVERRIIPGRKAELARRHVAAGIFLHECARHRLCSSLCGVRGGAPPGTRDRKSDAGRRSRSPLALQDSIQEHVPVAAPQVFLVPERPLPAHPVDTRITAH